MCELARGGSSALNAPLSVCLSRDREIRCEERELSQLPLSSTVVVIRSADVAGHQLDSYSNYQQAQRPHQDNDSTQWLSVASSPPKNAQGNSHRHFTLSMGGGTVVLHRFLSSRAAAVPGGQPLAWTTIECNKRATSFLSTSRRSSLPAFDRLRHKIVRFQDKSAAVIQSENQTLVQATSSCSHQSACC